MKEQVILDLDEYGVVIIEADSQTDETMPEQGLVQAGLGGVARDARDRIVVKATDTLQTSLSGLANTFAGSLSRVESVEQHDLSSFTVEFQVSLSVEAGAEVGVLAKIAPNGTFKCTYMWERKPENSD